MEDAHNVFGKTSERGRQPNEASFKILICGYCRYELSTKVMEFVLYGME